jgi:O-antigen/teichoic acid export membrane protein
MIRDRRTVSGAFTNGISLLVHFGSSLVLAPIILRTVGSADYGTWVLLLSVVGYFTLFDLGIRSAVVRFTAAHNATFDAESLSRLTGAALLTYSIVAASVVLLTVGLCYSAPALFHPAGNSAAAVRMLVLVLGLDAALSLPLGVFGGVLEGLQRFTFLNAVQITVTLLRAAGCLIALQMGGRLLAITLVAVTMRLAANIVITVHALALMPRAPSLAATDAAVLFRIARHSSAAFCLSIGDRLRFQADAIVISFFAPAVAITDFAMAARLSDIPGNFVQMITQVFTPASSRLSTLGEHDRMRELVLDGNFICALVTFASAALMVQVAPALLTLWAGAQYAAGAPVLVVLVGAKMLYFAQAVAQRALVGTGEHGALVRILGIEAALNLGLSLILAKPLGILGVAVGTAAPMAFTSLVFLPLLMTRTLKIPLTTYFQRVFLGPTIVATITLIGIRALPAPVLTWTDVVLRITIALTICATALTIWVMCRTHGGRIWAGGMYRR